MSKNISITFEELNKADMISIVSPIPINFLNHRSPGISDELKKKILHEQYKSRIVSDGLETGHLSLTDNGYKFNSKQSVSSFAGFVFEAYLVDEFNLKRTARLRAFQWATERSEGWSTKAFEEYKAVGTGLLSTKNKYLAYYEPQSNADIIFLRKNPLQDIMEPALIYNQQVSAKIQVKSIKYRFKEEIVDKVLSGKYLRVITMLSDHNGRPSWVICHNILHHMLRTNSITPDVYANAIGRIQGPEYLDLNQHYVDDYYNYIFHWYNGLESPTKHTDEAVEQEITGYKYVNNVLVPI
ncbi:hypothetical protein E4V36_14680 [Proteus mirabilis]|uniref:hypothetical protein n=1 Tax=Proteus TaxID=583 RepID=UPI001072B80B|nr:MULTISPECIES: hypothetical protein [Proteus]MCO4179790.1 hypothetical protein [Proteus terrae]MCO4189898.1 hypothetical protein [Proteus terrae]MCW9687998.1 hypothetical protein [Proteus terrae]TFT70400.1 hypothetical protein E4V36_14680 [Proteus mirabilis]TFT95937.1 hypothetical protein E4V35_10600 [Proteus mirabilis]